MSGSSQTQSETYHILIFSPLILISNKDRNSENLQRKNHLNFRNQTFFSAALSILYSGAHLLPIKVNSSSKICDNVFFQICYNKF